ncbi:LLM class flavin-dependent oxidoreductase [Streptomyces sp. NBC_00557]|uniref:LLM class flavin-dependent oxidoreductase n=1 Tax=Streptomyces sp. NBC_00557 TaxID=2975776 RepID=UPI002E814DA9|nr:LLM class flavin-dependent oxidoreductase [Streptomyces sp. NBC_00557]WUC40339.1 LLM class flavin-dependent oxidoreductase [Streptomyces sp. NBC_00557]
MHLFSLIGGVGHHQGAWRRPNSRAEGATSLDYYSDIAALAERGTIDALLMADGLSLNSTHLASGCFPHIEPLTMLSALAARTSRIGLVGSVSTTFSEPYNVARQFATLDHISAGRAAWNIVTSGHGEVNFGDQPLPQHSDRYERADEYVEVVTALWNSWEPDAIVLDRANGVYADAAKVHKINHVGKHFKVEGPLNVSRSPQGRPVLVQAGSSGTGRSFAARHAEVVFTAQQTLAGCQDFYSDMKARVRAAGRNPEQVKVLPGVHPLLGSTEAEALRMEDELRHLIRTDIGMAWLSKQLGGVDLSGLDPSRPVPEELLPAVETVQERRSRYEVFRQLAVEEKYSINRLIEAEVMSQGHLVMVGAPEQIADRFAKWVAEGGADGFMMLPSYLPEGMELIVDGVIPELRKRGLFRSEYTGTTLRDHLGLEPLAGPDEH